MYYIYRLRAASRAILVYAYCTLFTSLDLRLETTIACSMSIIYHGVNKTIVCLCTVCKPEGL